MSNYRRFYNPNYQYIFITMVTYNRTPLLLNNIEILRSSFKFSMQRYNYEIYACCILKDHIHLILKLENNKNYSEIIRLTKYHFSRNIKQSTQPSASKLQKREKGIWQRRYWEHTIRNENDMNIHLDYIHYNPYKHYKILPKNWEFSSFNKFVKLGFYERSWYNDKDFNNIKNLDFE